VTLKVTATSSDAISKIFVVHEWCKVLLCCVQHQCAKITNWCMAI